MTHIMGKLKCCDPQRIPPNIRMGHRTGRSWNRKISRAVLPGMIPKMKIRKKLAPCICCPYVGWWQMNLTQLGAPHKHNQVYEFWFSWMSGFQIFGGQCWHTVIGLWTHSYNCASATMQQLISTSAILHSIISTSVFCTQSSRILTNLM